MTAFKTLKLPLAITLFFLLITLLATFPLILNMDTHIYGPFYDTDLRGAIWHLWWYKQAIEQGSDFRVCPMMAAPFGIDLSKEPVSWAARWVLFGLLSILSPLMTLNVLTLLSLFMTGLISFSLIKHLTGSVAGALLAAAAFTISPYHLTKIGAFSFFFLGNWFVLFILSLMHARRARSLGKIILTGLTLGLTAAFSPYYGFFAMVTLVLIGIFDTLATWRARRLRNGVSGMQEFCVCFVGRIVPVIVIAGIAILFNAPVVAGVIKSFTPVMDISGNTAAAGTDYVRPLKYLIAQSARPLSYLLPAGSHPIFGPFTQRMYGSFLYGRGAVEQTLYLGWIPLLLALAAFRTWKERRRAGNIPADDIGASDDSRIGLFLMLGAAAFLLSLPPVIDLFIFKVYLPSFLLYKILPMFRAYARFGMVVMLCVSVLAGFGIKYILERLRTKRAKLLFTTLVLAGIAFEFAAMPPWRTTDISAAPAVYQWLAQQPQDTLVAEYPMAAAGRGEAQTEYKYQFAQTRHGKRLVNGAQRGTPAFEVKEAIHRVDAPETPGILKALGARYIIVHTERYGRGWRDDVAVAGKPPRVRGHKGYRFVRSFGSADLYEVIGPASVKDVQFIRRITVSTKGAA